MKINREAALRAFQNYISHYDVTREMIRLKVEHTYRVSELCEKIAGSIGLNQEDMDLAWLVGLLHDIGRFEQQKNYGTFIDADSIDHAEYGKEILFGKASGKGENPISIRDFVEEPEEDAVIRMAVGSHSAYRIPEGLDERTAMFCHILRDADKIDILKVNVEFPLEEIYNETTEKLYSGQVTPAVMKSFDEGHAVLRSLKQETVDYIVGHISLVYELVYPLSVQIVKEQGYLEKLMNFESWNPVTREQFAHIREKMSEYFAASCSQLELDEKQKGMDINELLQRVDCFYAENKGAEAEKLLLASMETAVSNQETEVLLQLLNELLGYYRETGQTARSFETAEQAIALAGEMGLQATIPYATTLLNAANAYRAGGRLQESLELYGRVREIYQKTLAPDNILIASLENNISLLYQEMGAFGKAKESLLTALEIVEKKGAEFETAVTYANLANTCLQLKEEEARQYAVLARDKFEKMGVQDFHYGAALSALGTCYYQEENWGKAEECFGKARDIMEQNLGRNEAYERLQENILQCERKRIAECARENSELHQEKREWKGMELCREYYEAYGRPMLEREFPEYVGKIAVGLAGEGSDCFGYDDEISRDHDWGPDFCMWVSRETYDKIGPRLQKAYEQLPSEFKGYHRLVSAQGAGRRGVCIIDAFYRRLLPVDSGFLFGGEQQRGLRESIDWSAASDASLAAAVNGEIFKDEEGSFSKIRENLKKGYPEPILYRKLAEGAAGFSQNGQYNYARCIRRGDFFTAGLMRAECVRNAMKLKHYLEGAYPPHDKWLKVSTEQLNGGKELTDLLERLLDTAVKDTAAVNALTEEIAALLIRELYAGNFISDIDNYLDAHTEELLAKAFLSELGDEEIIEKIVKLEFSAFDKVKNTGGRASCQNDWPTFYVMRKSQYLTWNRAMLLQYCYDFNREYSQGHNLIEEKYGRMMESTAPEEYERIKEHFPDISKEKQAIIEQIVELQVGWMEAFAEEYPKMAGNARSIHTWEDTLYNTSYETYLRGEISTYSDKMLELYGRYVVEYAAQGKNIAYDIMGNSAEMYGYNSLADAERGIQ